MTDASRPLTPARPINFVFLNAWQRIERTDLNPAAAEDVVSITRGWRRFLLGHRRKHWRAGLFQLIDLHHLGGLVLCETGAVAEIPPAFDEPFEPLVLGLDDPALKTLTPAKVTSDERGRAIGMRIVFGVLIAFAGFLTWIFLTRPSTGLRLMWILPVVVGMLLTIGFLRRTRATMAPWWIVPGAAFVRPLWRRDDGELHRFTPADTIPYLSKRHAKNHVFYVLELWTRDRTWSRVVTQREMLAFLAAWQSRLAPPPIEQMRELAS